ncbi:MAG: hypothetical protein HQL86_03285 [Magnetococcales bacterium]|nr:hypothetical protein [Magnetococcales bacterium]
MREDATNAVHPVILVLWVLKKWGVLDPPGRSMWHQVGRWDPLRTCDA